MIQGIHLVALVNSKNSKKTTTNNNQYYEVIIRLCGMYYTLLESPLNSLQIDINLVQYISTPPKGNIVLDLRKIFECSKKRSIQKKSFL